jgi:phosphoenolpyruvate synthase/pyruvate phosphate dikinase
MERTIATESVLWLGDPRCADAALVGPKAAHLSALAESHRVPDGFCITADAYRLAERAGGMPSDLARAVTEAYDRLVGGGAPDAPPPSVAVRSSAIDEDGPTASFAGQHETILDVVGIDAVRAAVERTWRSLHSDAALAYRRAHGLPVTGLALAVLVQRLVVADASGVAFSLDPVSGRRDRIVVNASWGLGESMVAGTVTPDTWTLDAASLEVLEERLASKERMTVAKGGATLEVAVPRFLRERAALEAGQLAEVAALARSLDAHQGWPVDIEFAYADGRLHLLQCRPVTSVAGGGAS